MKGPDERSHGKSSHCLSSCTQTKGFSFFKLMLQPIQSNKLRIPEMFASTYGDKLSTSVILTVPTQESWKVTLVKENNKLWFHDGWQDIVKYYSIGFAYFLQFIYEGNSKFELHIFDTTTCEICYTYKACNGPQGRKKPCDDHRGQVRFPRKKQLVENYISVEASHVIKLESEDETSLHEHDDEPTCEICYPYKACNGPQGRKKPCDDHRSQVRLPRKKQLVENDVSVEAPHVIKLESEDEPSLHENDDEQMHDHDHDHDGVTSGLFSSSSLASDDEQLDQYEQSKHSIKANDLKQGNPEYHWLKHQEALGLAGSSKPENPFFTAVIKKRHLQRPCCVYVPASFGHAYLRHRDGVKLEGPDGRKWPARCTKIGRYKIGAGWIFFARDYKLQTGNVCVFELIDAKNCVLKVQIVKESQIRSN